jgi:hypothetical protein
MPWRRMGEWRYSSSILHLGISWRWVDIFTHRQLYLRGKSPRYPLDRRLGGPQSRYGRCGVQKHFLPLPRLKPRPSNPSLYRLTWLNLLLTRSAVLLRQLLRHYCRAYSLTKANSPQFNENGEMLPFRSLGTVSPYNHSFSTHALNLKRFGTKSHTLSCSISRVHSFTQVFVCLATGQ